MTKHTLVQQAQAAIESGKLKDQSDTTAGFTYEPPAAGVCVARLVSYVEVGKHSRKTKFGEKNDDFAVIQFELLGKKHAKEIEVDGVKRTIYPVITERINISNSPRSWFHKLYKSLDYGRGFPHAAAALGEGFKLTIVHNTVGEGDDKRVYANIRDESSWLIEAPTREDENDEGELIVRNLKVPEATVDLRLFLWDSPSIEQWNSLFIEGTRTRKVDGKEVEVDNNWIQELITSANNFEGSAAQIMLASADLPDRASTDPSDDEVGLDEDDLDEPQETPPSDPADDPLADLGADGDLDELDDEIPF